MVVGSISRLYVFLVSQVRTGIDIDDFLQLAWELFFSKSLGIKIQIGIVYEKCTSDIWYHSRNE